MMDPRTPVLVGVGVAHRPPDGSAGVEPVELMIEAARAAVADSGAPALGARVRQVAVPAGNWSYPDPGALVADALGAAAATVLAQIGVPQETPVGVALDRIRRGDLDVALVVGGEAMASRLRTQRAGGEPDETPQPGAAPDETWAPQGELMADAEIQAGIWAPVEQYACIDNALRHAEGRSIAEQLDATARLWAAFDAVATTNPAADFAAGRSEEFLRAPGPDNRPLAFPYARWHSTQWSVDQAAALLLCSAGAARDAGVPPDRWVFPHVAVESSLSVSMSRRAELHRWPAMGVLGAAAAAHLGRPLTEIDLVELYSCFPVAVKVQQRELGLPADGVPTITGGMPFAGGPFNNFTYQATAAMVTRLRAEPRALGMVTTVSGLLTKPGLAVWSATPGERPVLLGDHVEAAGQVTGVLEVTGIAEGPAVVATYTVTYDGPAADGDPAPAKAFVVADLPGGGRWIGTTTDGAFLDRATREEVIGTPVVLEGRTCRSG